MTAGCELLEGDFKDWVRHFKVEMQTKQKEISILSPKRIATVAFVALMSVSLFFIGGFSFKQSALQNVYVQGFSLGGGAICSIAFVILLRRGCHTTELREWEETIRREWFTVYRQSIDDVLKNFYHLDAKEVTDVLAPEAFAVKENTLHGRCKKSGGRYPTEFVEIPVVEQVQSSGVCLLREGFLLDWYQDGEKKGALVEKGERGYQPNWEQLTLAIQTKYNVDTAQAT